MVVRAGSAGTVGDTDAVTDADVDGPDIGEVGEVGATAGLGVGAGGAFCADVTLVVEPSSSSSAAARTPDVRPFPSLPAIMSRAPPRAARIVPP
jgi:hypothetical protein